MWTKYPIDTLIELTGTFADTGGNLVDPATVTLYVMDPAGTETIYTGGQITRASVGRYTFDLAPSLHGPWIYKWQGSNDVIVTSFDQYFIIEQSALIAG